MEENKIFGSNVVLPSLPGLQSDCEEEILMLMKEVDDAFQKKHGELLYELKNVRSLCRSQRDEIENLRCLLLNSHENSDLKTENYSLQRQIQRLPESELQLDSLKRSLSMQQDENKSLKERLLNINQQYETLRNSYQRLVNTLAAHRQSNDKLTKNKVGEASASELVEAQIAQMSEKFVSEDTEFCNDFQLKINKEIDDLERRLKEELL